MATWTTLKHEKRSSGFVRIGKSGTDKKSSGFVRIGKSSILLPDYLNTDPRLVEEAEDTKDSKRASGFVRIGRGSDNSKRASGFVRIGKRSENSVHDIKSDVKRSVDNENEKLIM